MNNNIKVLLADDHKVFRQTLAAFLGQVAGVQVIGEAADGNEAITMSNQLRPDVVLLDLNMPQKNGYEASRIIKAHMPSTKVFIVSSHDEDIYRTMARQNLANGYFSKTSLKDEILRLIDELIAGRESQSIAA